MTNEYSRHVLRWLSDVMRSVKLSCQSANYVRTELPVRIAHRIRDLQALPYVVVKQEWVAKVYEASLIKLKSRHDAHLESSFIGVHLKSTSARSLTSFCLTSSPRLRKYPEVHTQEDNREFCKFLRGILDEQYASFLLT